MWEGWTRDTGGRGGAGESPGGGEGREFDFGVVLVGVVCGLSEVWWSAINGGSFEVWKERVREKDEISV